MSTRLHMVVSDELLAAVDSIRGDVPRSRWIGRLMEERVEEFKALPGHVKSIPRGASEQALGGDVKRSLRSQDVATRSPAPARQPRTAEEAVAHREAWDKALRDNAEAAGQAMERPVVFEPRVRSSASRPFRPAPKKGQ